MSELNEASEEKLNEKTRQLSAKEGAVASVMGGAGDAYVSPYALELGASNYQIGLLSSLAGFLGPLSQIIGSRLIGKFHRKKIIFWGVFFQATAWVALAVLGLWSLWQGKGPWLIPIFIAGYVMFAFSGALGNPAWFSMMGDIVPDRIRGKYFSHRNRLSGLVTVSVTLLASVWLYYAKGWNIVIWAFISLCLLAAAARYVSSYLFTRHHISELKLAPEHHFSFWQFLRRAPETNFGRFTIYVVLMNLAVNIANPFFSVYLWKELHLNPIWFTLINTSMGIFSIIALPFWGRFSDKYGNREMLRISSLLIALGSIFYIFSAKPLYLILVPQLMLGAGWAAFNLSTSNFIYDAVRREKRGICIAYYSILNGAAVFLGANIGGALTQFLTLNFMNVFLFVFLASGILRGLLPLTFLRLVSEVRQEYHPPKANPLAYLGEMEPFYDLVKEKLNPMIDGLAILGRIPVKVMKRVVLRRWLEKINQNIGQY